MKPRLPGGIVLGLLTAQAIAAADQPLSFGQSTAFSLAADETRTFAVPARDGGFVEASAAGNGATLTLMLKHGAEITARVKSLGGTGGAATVRSVDTSGAGFTLEIHRVEKKGSPAAVTLVLAPARTATDADKEEAAVYQAGTNAKTASEFESLRKRAAAANDTPLTLTLALAQAASQFGAGDYQGALQTAQEFEPVAGRAELPRVAAQFLYLAGLSELLLERNGAAATALRQALELSQPLDQPYETGSILHNLAAADFLAGDCERALNEAERALALRREVADGHAQAMSLLAIAKDYVCMGDAQNALDAYRALIPQWQQLKDDRNQAASLNEMGVVYTETGAWDKARLVLDESLQLRDKAADVGGQGESLVNLGLLALRSHEYAKASGYFDRALALPKDREYKRRMGYALEGKAEAISHLGRKPEAVAMLRESLAYIRDVGDPTGESLVHRVLGEVEASPEEYRRAAELAQGIGDKPSEAIALTNLGGLQLRRGDVAAAKQALEPAVDLIEGSRATLRDPRLRMDYLAASREAYELSIEALTASGSAGREAAFAVSERAHARTLLDAIGTTATPPADLRTIQAEALDGETALAEYFLGDRKSWLWLATKDSFEMFELPARSVLEPMIRRYYSGLSARSAPVANETLEQRAARIRVADRKVETEGAQLGQILLGPVRARIGKRRLLVADDGLLRLAPMASMGIENEIVLIPSGSYVVESRRRGSAALSGRILILADPEFRGADYPSLPWTRREADAIAALAPAGQAEERLGADASVGMLRNAASGKFEFIHVATHTVVDGRNSQMSGIVLATADREGRSQPGILRLRDIYQLHLRTELVTLSACESGVGENLAGEGMIGLSHAFLFAGARQVVASLWKVEDAATQKLMVAFYRGMYQQKLKPAAALHAAQREVRADARYRAPYYWAGFAMEGDGR